MVGYHRSPINSAGGLRGGGGHCEALSRSRGVPGGELEFFENFFEYRP